MIEYITYYEWQQLLDKALENGSDENMVDKFIHSYPVEAGSAGAELIYSQIGKFVTVVLNSAFVMIQNAINESFEEVDIDLADMAVNRLKKKIRICLFYNHIAEFSDEYKTQLNDAVINGVQDFDREFKAYLRRCMEESSDVFLEDIEYLFRRNNLNDYVNQTIGDLRSVTS